MRDLWIAFQARLALDTSVIQPSRVDGVEGRAQAIYYKTRNRSPVIYAYLEISKALGGR